MNTIKQIQRGDSLSVLFRFNPEYDHATLESFKAFANGEDKTIAVGDGTFRMELTSEYTFGKSLIPIEVEVIDQNFGVRKQVIGVVKVNRTVNTSKSADVDKGAGIVVTVNVADNVVTTDVELISYIRGLSVEDEQKILDAETERQAAETIRGNNEIARQTKETERQSAETTRGNNETARQTKETERQAAETTRGTNETARQTKETERQAAETTRGTNETARQTKETERQQAEAARQAAGYITSSVMMQVAQLTQAQYDALPVKVSTTLYLIIQP